MHGYLYGFLVFCLVALALCDSGIPISDHDDKTNFNRRKLPIFPKSNLKFIVTPPPLNKVGFTLKPKAYVMPKITLFTHNTPKYKEEVETATYQSTRKPVMKLRTFTIETPVNGKYKKMKQYGETKNTRKINSVETSSETNMYRHKSIENIENKTENVTNKYTKLPKITSEKGEHFSKQEPDVNEFIFLEKNTEKQKDDLLEKETEYDFETTTYYQTVDTKTRHKRDSKNIIEEENMASTISPLKKFTGRDNRQTSNYYFKNINL